MLSRPEIIAKAAAFSDVWKDAKDEDAEAKSFWDELFLVYGTPRKNVAKFEVPIKRRDGVTCFIDLLWKGKVVVEHKSRGKSLTEARKQAQEYVLQLKPAERPEWLVVCDFQRFEVVKQSDASELTFTLAELAKNIDALGFIGGFTPKKPSTSSPVNIKAVEILGDVYDNLKVGGYPPHELASFLVRILFALFAEDTAIFEPEQFRDLILENSKENGSDLGPLLGALFETLNTPETSRQTHLPLHLAAFPYVNGALFSGSLPSAAMTKGIRESLLRATEFDWTQISPAIFGSLFQSVMEAPERRALGAHYTSEDDIMKVIGPLFLDELAVQVEAVLIDKSTKRDAKIDALHEHISKLRFLDPACGCGNFLIVAYRELRALETKLLVARHKTKVLDVALFVKLNVDMMFGIEIEEFPSEIAKVGMWLMDHICNTELAAAFGKSFTRLPLTKSAAIVCANALTTNWKGVLSSSECSFVMGNPPFHGKKEQSDEMKAEVKAAFSSSAKTGNLDFVTAWYARAASYIQNTEVRCAFVSTNSISQGEQVAELWAELFKKGIKIDFAHRTFAWRSEARGAAHVHVVIIGFSLRTTPVNTKTIYDHSDVKHVRVITAKNINPYLVEGSDLVVQSRRRPLSANAPTMSYGSMMIDKSRKAGDDEGLVFDPTERAAILASCPSLKPFVRVIYGGEEYLNGDERYCLWFPSSPPSFVSSCSRVMDRIRKVKMFRQTSGRAQTKKLAALPYRFGEVRQPKGRYLFVPKVGLSQDSCAARMEVL